MLTLSLLTLLAAEPALGVWTPLGPGVDYARRALDPKAKTPAVLQVVRVDPEVATLKLGLATRDGPLRPASAWAESLDLVAVINAGMYAREDFRLHVGKLVDGAHVNQASLNGYRSALLLRPRRTGLPRAQLVDLDDAAGRKLTEAYETVVQNLRLVKAPGVSVWRPNGRAWSEAALAQDRRGRILFLFVREGVQMSEFNRLILDSDLEVVRAMHLEGGPEASLSVRGPVRRDDCGSYETGFREDDTNVEQWDLPNVLGVARD